GLYVTGRALAGSVHAGLSCVDCHDKAASLPHPPRLGPPSCQTSGCHSSIRNEYLLGSHGRALARGEKDAPGCADCHGGHDILPASEPRSRTHPANSVKLCAECHGHGGPSGAGPRAGGRAVRRYLQSVHGRALMRGGLIVSASCVSCHGAHRVLPPGDANSPVNRRNVAATCGKCHVRPAETYSRGIHGRHVAAGDAGAPSCADCHTAHAITRADSPAFKGTAVARCGRCHDESSAGGGASPYRTYLMSYHGQAVELGLDRSAGCYDCHGAHDTRALDDPACRLSAANRPATCRKCHPSAGVGLADFRPHADYRDVGRFPLLGAIWVYFVAAISISLGFFGLHGALWLVRGGIERFRRGRSPSGRDRWAVRRFSPAQRLAHGVTALSVFALALTGLPLLFAGHRWAAVLVGLLGGPAAAGVVHRLFAVVFTANFAVHVAGIIARRRRAGRLRESLGGPATILPRWKDIEHCAAMFRWFIRGGNGPAFDHWTYWEKFDYLAEFLGSVIIICSGLLLWLPGLFGRFLPGAVFNVAAVVHGYEALLAVTFIFTIHFFHAHLRPGKFPADDVIFTGVVAEEDLRRERPAEYQRLVRTGRLDELRTAPPPRGYRRLAVAAGLLAGAVGLALVVLIVLAKLGWD
ncbi:MAG: hypothetical protein J7M21_06160, partial [Planctomycetes bacterium]|nr:hypothetical protein [Planctomycetota bacterium]